MKRLLKQHSFMVMEESSDAGFQVRNELMVSASGDANPTMRVAHFLQPIINSIDEPVLELPSHSLPPTSDPRNWPLKVTIPGFIYPQINWKTWVEKMASLHANTWKKAGIHEAIFNSTYKIRRNNDLILGLAEKWCPLTKSFIFSWGEATITLEDVLILGFSVLGSPVFSPLETPELNKIQEKLEHARLELNQSASKKPTHAPWMNKFMDTGSDIEHEAFLSLWLSRFVFASSHNVINKHVFPIAIHLARGTRIALAPAILASIYRYLSLLKEKIVALNNLDNTELSITIRSQFQFVQVWAWERFIELRPKPNLIQNGEPRLAQWHDISMEAEKNVRMTLDTAIESFDWRPYCKSLKNWNLPMFYAEKQMWVSVDSDFCDELESFARCLRVSELVGLDCIEQYLPHRVAMQFGMDQDLPACVARANQSPSVAWSDYIKPIGYLNLYIPSRLFEADVTTRYLNWWKQSLSRLQAASEDVLDHLPLNRVFRSAMIEPKRLKGAKEKTPKKAKGMKKVVPFSSSRKGWKVRKYIESFKITPKRFAETKKGVGTSIPLKSGEKSKRKERDTGASIALGSAVKKVKDSAETLKEHKRPRDGSALPGLPSIMIKKEYGDLSVPPGFAPKPKLVVEGNDSKSMEDNLTISELLKSGKKHDDLKSKQIGDAENLSGQSFSSSYADNEAVEKKEETIIQHEPVMVGSETDTTMKDSSDSKTGSPPSHDIIELEAEEDEDRIEVLLCRVERIAEELKARTARLGQKWLLG